jgi:actin-related protein 8
MPRGIPNAKRDDTGMRYTTFNVPLALNPKQHVGATYLKSESTRKNRALEETGSEQRRGSHVIVIHPGSRWLRIGKASDVNPISVLNVIGWKTKPPVPMPVFVEGISRPRKGRTYPHQSAQTKNGDEYAVPITSDDPFETKIAAITVSLRERMRFYKLRVTPNSAGIASTFNEQFKPEIIQEYNDPFRVDWLYEPSDDFIIGENVLRLSDPQRLGYAVRWPIHGAKFNTRDYPSLQVILSDIETIIRSTLKEKLDVDVRDYQNYSVVLVIPDFYDRAYVHDFVNLLLVTMGFKQVCAQQESLAATFGAGISNACVVDIGSVTTSIACVDEGLVISDTRMSLNMGGDDITEFLSIMLDRINFPYGDINLARGYDWNLMEDLKARICTLAEGDVALNLYDFLVRQPGKPTEKYGLRAYDEIILAPMCIFEPRVIEFDRKRIGQHPSSHPDVSDEIMEHAADHVTQAMMISTQHLMPSPPAQNVASESSGTQTPGKIVVSPQLGTSTLSEGTAKQEQQDTPMGFSDNTTPAPSTLPDGSSDPSMEFVDVEGETKAPPSSTPAPSNQPSTPKPSVNNSASAATYPGGFAIDVCFEASKLPLDVAIFNSARAAGGDEKIRKYLQAVLVIGGTALIPGMAHALESRLQAIATPLVPNMEKVQIIPPPKEVDPRVLAWKGAAVLGKMDGVADLWLTGADWDILGMRGLKERCFHL